MRNVRNNSKQIEKYDRNGTYERQELKLLDNPSPGYRNCMKCDRTYWTGGPQWKICPSCKRLNVEICKNEEIL